MERNLNPFDKQIKDAYESYEAEFDHSSWDEMSKKLDHMAPSPVKYFAALSSGIAAAGIVFLTLLFIWSETNNTESKPEIVVENVDNSGIQSNNLTSTTSDQNSENARTSQDSIIAESNKSEQADEDSSHALDNNNEQADETHKVQYTTSSPIAQSKKQDAPVTSTSQSSASTADQNKVAQATKAIGNDAKITGSGTSNKRMVHTSCKGLTIEFEASKDYGKDAKFLWNFGDGFFSNEANPSHTFNKSGTFDVSLSVTSYTTGQITSNVVQASIEVLEAPRARTTVSIPTPNEVHFENISLGDDTAEWLIDGNAQGSSALAIVPMAAKGEKHIQLVALNETGCSDTLNQFVTFGNAGHVSVDRAKEGEFKSTMPGDLYIFDAIQGSLIHTGESGKAWNVLDTNHGQYIYVNVVQDKDSITIARGTVEIK